MKYRILALILGVTAIMLLASATLAQGVTTLETPLPSEPAVNSHHASTYESDEHPYRGDALDVRSADEPFFHGGANLDGELTDVFLEKSVHASIPIAGHWINYFIHYENKTEVVAHIMITDTMPDGVIYEEAYWGGGDQPDPGEPLPDPTIIGNQLVWALGELEGGGSRWFHIQANISETLSAGDVITNCATIGVIGGDDKRPQDNTSCHVLTLRPQGPNLSVSKSSEWSADRHKLHYSIRFMNAGDQQISDVWITDTVPISTTWSGWSEVNPEPLEGRVVFSGTLDGDALGWNFSYLDPGDAGSLHFDANLDEPGVPLRWFTNTVEIDTPSGETNPDDNLDIDLGFSGGEVQEVHIWVAGEDSSMWGLAQPDTVVTVTTPYEQIITWANPDCGGCWDMPDVGPIWPGDVVTATAGAATLPIEIQVPDPFTAGADSTAHLVWGQIDTLDQEWVEVDLSGVPILDAQTDGNGNYSAVFPEFPRGGAGEVRYTTEVDYAVVIFHRGFRSPDLVLSVNYAHDWVNARYEPGHTVWITVTESDGLTTKATAEATTGPVPLWEGESGFQTAADDWAPEQPDIVPWDWVYGSVDNGYTSTVQAGEITGYLDVDADTISGTVDAPWIPGTVHAICAVWEEGGPVLEFMIDPDDRSYFCNFAGMWDLQLGHDVGVQYQEPDGEDWVINVFRESHLVFLPLVMKNY